MTRLWIFSDLHYEKGNSVQPVAPDHDVCIVAGDLNHLQWSIDMLKRGELGNGNPTIYVPGNHDYYRQDSMQAEERLAEKRVEQSNVFLCNPAEYVFHGIRFLGCTLWTDYELYGDAEKSMRHALAGMNDHRLIKTKPPGLPVVNFNPAHALWRHKRELAWLEARLKEPFLGATVIISHHSPSPKSVPDRFDGDPLTPAFSSNLEWLIEKYQPTLWVHGHTHDSFDYNIGKTRIVCNPAGYQHEPNLDFQWDLVIDIEDYDPAPTMGL
jgi:Icc-related predicted phosphoesterase